MNDFAKPPANPASIPAATVILAREGPGGVPEFLLVQRGEQLAFAGGALVFPGGRVDASDIHIARNPQLAFGFDGLSDVDAAARVTCAREALEETAWHFHPRSLVGIYQWTRPQGDITYLRFAYGGRVEAEETGRALDEGIVRAVWMTPDEIRATADRHRSPLILQCVEDWLGGARHPLALVHHH